MRILLLTICFCFLTISCIKREDTAGDRSLTQCLLDAANEGDYSKADQALAAFADRHNDASPEELFKLFNDYYKEMQRLGKTDAVTLSVFITSEEFYNLPAYERFNALAEKATSQSADTAIDNELSDEPDLLDAGLYDELTESFDLQEPAYY